MFYNHGEQPRLYVRMISYLTMLLLGKLHEGNLSILNAHSFVTEELLVNHLRGIFSKRECARCGISLRFV